MSRTKINARNRSNPNAPTSTVALAKRLLLDGASNGAVAQALGLSKPTVAAIRTGARYADVRVMSKQTATQFMAIAFHVVRKRSEADAALDRLEADVAKIVGNATA